jgi:redox-sensitive bicupin YhaK (pirin superfamily)
MSYRDAPQPVCEAASGPIHLVIRPKEKDLGEFTVRRVLPAPEQRMVGPFVFFDHMGPAEFPPGQGIQVRPHPHIGIATITYLFEGEIVHRDSLGFHLPIYPGAVNLMTAGRGIVHSERAGSDLDQVSRLHGIQSWMALPEGQEEIEPAFVHTPAAELPKITRDGATIRIIIGEAFGEVSPVQAYSRTLYLDCRLPAGSTFTLPDGYAEIAFYVASGQVITEGVDVPEGTMIVPGAGMNVRLQAAEDSRVMVVGGERLGRRRMWWNFVSTSAARIEQAKRDWRSGAFGAVPGDDQFIPLPE